MILAITILIVLAAGLILLLKGIRKKHKTLTVISGLAALVFQRCPQGHAEGK